MDDLLKIILGWALGILTNLIFTILTNKHQRLLNADKLYYSVFSENISEAKNAFMTLSFAAYTISATLGNSLIRQLNEVKKLDRKKQIIQDVYNDVIHRIKFFSNEASSEFANFLLDLKFIKEYFPELEKYINDFENTINIFIDFQNFVYRIETISENEINKYLQNHFKELDNLGNIPQRAAKAKILINELQENRIYTNKIYSSSIKQRKQ